MCSTRTTQRRAFGRPSAWASRTYTLSKASARACQICKLLLAESSLDPVWGGGGVMRAENHIRVLLFGCENNPKWRQISEESWSYCPVLGVGGTPNDGQSNPIQSNPVLTSLQASC
jgi:hypothetical protein